MVTLKYSICLEYLSGMWAFGYGCIINGGGSKSFVNEDAVV